MHYFQLILTTALQGRKAGVLVLVFINEGTAGPEHFTDEREAPEVLGEGVTGWGCQGCDPYHQVPLLLRSQLGQGCLFSSPPQH